MENFKLFKGKFTYYLGKLVNFHALYLHGLSSAIVHPSEVNNGQQPETNLIKFLLSS